MRLLAGRNFVASDLYHKIITCISHSKDNNSSSSYSSSSFSNTTKVKKMVQVDRLMSYVNWKNVCQSHTANTRCNLDRNFYICLVAVLTTAQLHCTRKIYFFVVRTRLPHYIMIRCTSLPMNCVRNDLCATLLNTLNLSDCTLHCHHPECELPVYVLPVNGHLQG